MGTLLISVPLVERWFAIVAPMNTVIIGLRQNEILQRGGIREK
jgi:hypothetical protein